jgi:DNA modification methylase
MIIKDGKSAYELMHKELDKTWKELKRVVKSGGIVCINIGDATRTIDDDFALYPNHARVISKMVELGFDVLPEIIWHKPTNSPNKFMGSGMLPSGAYVTLEHEYILIFRKDGKRVFSNEEKELRRNSSYFWEERNEWFSDIWDFKGKKQKIESDNVRGRSAAFPCELPKRLILMFSQYGDTVLDPFFGTGTTMKAAMLFGRNSVGYDVDEQIIEVCKQDIIKDVENNKLTNRTRMKNHIDFIKNRIDAGKEIKHKNEKYDFPVVTAQERDIVFYYPSGIIEDSKNNFTVEYKMMDGICFEKEIASQRVQKKIIDGF